MFAFSKVLEFGDTLFILLRKQKLIFLHWIHHILTLVYCWYSLFSLPAHSRWLAAMNFLVHSFMYSYYAVMASGWRIPRGAAQCLTAMQILQMAIGLYTQVQALVLSERVCRVPPSMAWFGATMYALFFALFTKFFVDKYGRAGKAKQSKVEKGDKVE